MAVSIIYVLMFLLQSLLRGDHKSISEAGGVQSVLISCCVGNPSLNSYLQSETPAYV